MTFHLRVDLDHYEIAPSIVDTMTEHVVRHGSCEALIIAVGADASRCDGAVVAINGALSRAGVDVIVATRAYEGLFWLYDSWGEPNGGAPQSFEPQTHPKALQARLEGLTMAESREALAAQFSRADAQDIRHMHEHFIAVAGEFEAFREGRTSAEVLDVGYAAVERFLRNEKLSDADAARLAMWVGRHKTIRDYAWTCLSQEMASKDLAFWVSVAQRAVPPFESDVWCLAALAGWLTGSGVIARTCLDNAADADPDHTLARLLSECLDRGLSPSQMLLPPFR